MAVLQRQVVHYIRTMFKQSKVNGIPVWQCDPLLSLWLSETHREALDLSVAGFFPGRTAAKIGKAKTLTDAFRVGFSHGLLKQGMAVKIERQVVSIKLGFPHLPATTASIIMQGFGAKYTAQDISDVYASHGLSRETRYWAREHDFQDINRRVAWLAELIEMDDNEQTQRLQARWERLCEWLLAPKGKRELVLKNMPIKRGTFFHWRKSFIRLGLLGLIEPGPELFRKSKIGIGNEARLVIDKLQHPDRPDSFYVQRLRTMGIAIKRDAIAKVFSKWAIPKYRSAFVSNLERLESIPQMPETPEPQPTCEWVRLADKHFVCMWQGIHKHPFRTVAPGLFTLWAYIEELEIFELLQRMGLTKPPTKGGYAWADLMLFDIARRFFGISTASAACEAENPELPFFAHLMRGPCNDTLLKGLAHITEQQTVELRQWLVTRLASLGLATGRRVAFDFHEIDQDVQLFRLRQFGKGPSPKKKLCYPGFRPHLAWDIDQATLLVAEFRKASARGPTTIRRFVGDYILPTFRDLFDTVYVDSEYTGKDVWNFILDKERGMGANLVGCLKQNPLVRKVRDEFLNGNAATENFWRYYDDDYVYSANTFKLDWEYGETQKGEPNVLSLHCLVKKHVQTGRLRTFGSSKGVATASEILKDYSNRWTIEIAIKDLVNGYFLDKCPGENPHAVDVHFLIVTICRTLYRMIERDLGSNVKNPDGTRKTLGRTRNMLFRQGIGKLRIEEGALVVSMDTAYSRSRTDMLRDWFAILTARHQAGLTLLGGLALKFETQPAQGPEFKNAGKKLPLALAKIPDPDPQMDSFS